METQTDYKSMAFILAALAISILVEYSSPIVTEHSIVMMEARR